MKRDISFYFVVFLLCVFLSCLSTDYDYDLFARLIVGQRFIEDGILPFKDFLSYTPTHQWYDHEWGSGVVFYLLLKFIGPFGLIIFQALFMFGTMFFVIKTQKLQKHAYPKSLIFISIFCSLFFVLNSALVRCQLFSFFFFAMFLYFCEKTRKRTSNLLWYVPLITIFWNNVHGGVVSGLGLIFMYAVGAILEKKPWRKYIAVLSVATPLLVINPYGVKYLEFLFSATTMQRKYITEWWPFYHPRHILYYLPSSLFVVFSYILSLYKNIKKLDITKFIVLTVTLYMGLAHVKLLSLSLITISALCYNDIVSLIIKFKKNLVKVEKSLYAVLFIIVLLIPLSSPLYPRAGAYKFPLYEIEFLKINDIKGNIVVPFGLGSYACYKLYPDNLIFMDGRYEEVYDNKEFLMLRNYELAEENWRDIVNNYDTEILMPRKIFAIYDVLKQDKDWVHIFDGRICGVFVKKENIKQSYIDPEYKINYYKRTMFKGPFGVKTKKEKKYK